MNTSTKKVTVKGHSGKTSVGEVNIRYFSDEERLSRTIKLVCAMVVLMIMTIFVPIAHFIVPPSILIALFIVPPMFYKIESTILGGKYNCPACNHPQEIEKSSSKWPLEDRCLECGEPLQLNLASTEA